MKKKEYKYYTKAISLGNGKRKYIRGKTKRELDKKVIQFMLEQQGEKAKIVTTDMTVEQIGTLWLEKVKKPSVKPQSYSLYDTQLRVHVYPYIGDMRVSDVKPIHVIDVVNTHGYGTKYANSKLLSTLRMVFNFAVENELIAKSPAASRFTLAGSAMRDDKPLTPTQTSDLLAYLKAKKKDDAYLFTLLALVTGMRRGELCALRWDCVDLQAGELYVRRQMISSTGEITDDLKTEAAKRTIPLSADVVALLRKIKASSRSTYVLTGEGNDHLSVLDIDRFATAWNRSGVSEAPIHAHLFRKTFATRLIESGTDPKRVQYLLGHETLDMTLRVYAKYDKESQIEQTRKMIGVTFDSYVAI